MKRTARSKGAEARLKWIQPRHQPFPSIYQSSLKLGREAVFLNRKDGEKQLQRGRELCPILSDGNLATMIHALSISLLESLYLGLMMGQHGNFNVGRILQPTSLAGKVTENAPSIGSQVISGLSTSPWARVDKN